jgi:hypothetical protein
MKKARSTMKVDRACEDVPQRYTAGFEKALLNGVAPGKVL